MDKHNHLSLNIYQEIIKQSPICNEIYNSEGELTYVNQACLDMFGIESLDVIKGFKIFNEPHLTPEHFDTLHKGIPLQFILQYDFDKIRSNNIYPTRKKGQMMLDVQISVIFDESKQKRIGYIVINQDITEQTKLREELRVKAEVNKNLFTQLGFFYVYAHYDSNLKSLETSLLVKEVNEVFEKAYGYTAKSIENKLYLDVFPAQRDTELWDLLVNDVVIGRKNLEYDLYDEKTKQWLKIFFYSPYPGFLFAISRDISEEKLFLGSILSKVEDLYQVLKPALHKKSQTEDPLSVYEQLTEKEKKIVLLVLKGFNNKKIAKEMFCAEPTAKKHISDIYKKLNISKRFELIQMFKDYIFDDKTMQ